MFVPILYRYIIIPIFHEYNIPLLCVSLNKSSSICYQFPPYIFNILDGIWSFPTDLLSFFGWIASFISPSVKLFCNFCPHQLLLFKKRYNLDFLLVAVDKYIWIFPGISPLYSFVSRMFTWLPCDPSLWKFACI